MSAKDQIAGGMIGTVLKMMPTEYEIKNPVAQFLCDEIDKVLDETEFVTVIKAQLANKANADPNGVLKSLVTVYNDKVLVTFHNDIEEFVNSLNEAESATDDDPDSE
jgi:hypothetical protein